MNTRSNQQINTFQTENSKRILEKLQNITKLIK
jgi:hypothetical protein